jgi:hypothetical protein
MAVFVGGSHAECRVPAQDIDAEHLQCSRKTLSVLVVEMCAVEPSDHLGDHKILSSSCSRRLEYGHLKRLIHYHMPS